MPKICQFENCRNRASYALTYGNPDRCKQHKEDRKPQYSICKCGKAQPTFNNPGETKAICCSQCKTDAMIDVISKRCKCGKAQPTFNEDGETRAICCAKCKTETMIDVKCKRCKCGKPHPIYNEPGETLPIFCSECKTETMVNVVSKRCKCGKAHPTFNNTGEKQAICCNQCKTETMIDVVNKRCKCGKARPTYNEEGETLPIFCSECKTETMVNVVSKRCICGKAQPTYNEPGETRAICCNQCKTDTMVNVVSKRCKSELCDTHVIRKYKGYCAWCFQHLFPDDPLNFQMRCKTKEIAVRDYINIKFDGFSHDKPLSTGGCDCTMRRRLDHYKLIGNTMLVIETDENQHKSYDKMDEEVRYNDLMMVQSGKWIYIRFNPDKYIATNGKRKNPEIATRLRVLEKEIEKQIKRIESGENQGLLERVYLYYDGYT